MALRLVYQISSTVIKPTFFGNTSECLRRFRSLSPALKRSEERRSSPSRNKDWNDCTRRRSHSYPSKTPRRTGSRCFNRSLSTEKDNERDVGEDQDSRDDSDYISKQEHARKVMQTKSSPKLSMQRQTSSFKLQNQFSAHSADKVRSNSAIGFNKSMEYRLPQYYLKDSTPEQKKDNVFNVFDYYSEQYRRRASRVMPHLQPHNLKPYGTGENLTFPTDYKRSQSIKYPVMERQYSQQAGKKTQNKEVSDKDKQSFTTSRDFCTASSSDEQLQICKKVLAEYKARNPGYTSSNKKISPGSLEEATFLQKTIKLISDFNSQQIRRKSKSCPSEDLQKCNQVISEYKKINPDYKPPNKDVRSGSQEEKEAVNEALKFAANYKQFCSKKPSTNEQPKWNSSAQSELEEPETIPSIFNRTFSLPNIQKKPYSTTILVPQIMSVKVGPKANLLQSNALPDVTTSWDNLSLNSNEKLVSPWPSYADHLKNQLHPQKNQREIIYPPMPDDSKFLKNTKNIKIQAGNLQPKVALSTSSLPKRSNSPKAESTWKGDPGQGANINTRRTSLPNLRYFRRGFSSSSKGKVCDEKTVPRKRSKSKDVCNVEIETPPTPTEFFNSHDCGCIEPKPPVDVPPLKRLKKRSIPKEPPKVCPVPKTCTTPRADAKLKIESKKLPKLCSPKDCPCVVVKMKEGPPLSRPKKACKDEPPEVSQSCKPFKCAAVPRADHELKVKKKSLPKLIPAEDCPCIERKFEDVPPLKPLKKVKIPEPKKVPKIPRCYTAPRADTNLKTKDKPLRKIRSSTCPCVENAPLKTVPLVRLKKVPVEKEPPKVCITIRPCENAFRADGKLKLSEKSLPVLKSEPCPCVEAQPPQDVKPLKRLIRRSTPVEIPKVCPKPKICTIPRADEKLKIEPKQLPLITSPEKCPCVEIKMKKGTPLKRLTKQAVEHSPRPAPPCPKFKCPPRADEKLKVARRSLPKLEAKECPCVERKIPVDVPRLKPLPKVEVKAPENKFPPPKKQCLPRADDKLEPKPRQLRKLPIAKCACVENKPLKDVPLPRLKKVEVCEPSNECTKSKDPCAPTETDRADEICKYKPKVKKLPPMLLKAEKNHISIRSHNKDKKSKGPRLNTCHKRKFSMYTKIGKAKPPRIVPLRKINSYCKVFERKQNMSKMLTRKFKTLPKIQHSKFKLKETAQKNKYSSSKGNANCKNKKKCLPKVVVVTKCHKVDTRKLYSQRKRLPKREGHVENGSKKSSHLKDQQLDSIRSDELMEYKKKTLPKLMVSKIPCIDEHASMVDGPPLKRLETSEEKVGKKKINTTGGNSTTNEEKHQKKNIKLTVAPKFKKFNMDWKSIIAHHKFGFPRKPVPKTDRNINVNEDALTETTDKTNKPCLVKRPLKGFAKLDSIQKEYAWKHIPNTRVNLCQHINRVQAQEQRVSKYLRNSAPSPERADDLLGYEYSTKKLPPLIPGLKKWYHTVGRRNSYPTLPYGHKRISTTPRLQKDASSSKDCPKIGKKKKTCTKIKVKGCKPKARDHCNDDYKFKKCSKSKTPYPSFSECGEVSEWPTCEGQTDLKYLQPHYPIIKEIELLKPPTPDDALVDVKKEAECALKKLGKKSEGETRTCENFDEPPKELTAKEILKEGMAEKKEKATKGVCPVKKESKEACPIKKEVKSQGSSKIKCPEVSTKKCTEAKKESKKSAKTCPTFKTKKKTPVKAATKKTVTSKCKPNFQSDAKSKSKPASKTTCKAPSSSSKSTTKPSKEAKSKSKTSIGKSESKAKMVTSGPPAVIKEDKPKGFFARILAFFTSKPKDSGKSMAPKKSSSTTKKTASATGKSLPADKSKVSKSKSSEVCKSKSSGSCKPNFAKDPKSQKSDKMAKCGLKTKQKGSDKSKTSSKKTKTKSKKSSNVCKETQKKKAAPSVKCTKPTELEFKDGKINMSKCGLKRKGGSQTKAPAKEAKPKSKKCPKPPKSFCKGKNKTVKCGGKPEESVCKTKPATKVCNTQKIKSKPKKKAPDKCKLPTKKGASKVKQKKWQAQAAKKGKMAKEFKSIKACTGKKKPQKGKSGIKCPSTGKEKKDKCKLPTKKGASKVKQKKWQAKAAKKGKMAKKFKSVKACTGKKKPQKGKSGFKCPSTAKEKKDKCKVPTLKAACKVKKKPIPKKPKSICGSSKNKPKKMAKRQWQIKAAKKGKIAKEFRNRTACKPKAEDNSKFANMFPPDMPVCIPKGLRIVRRQIKSPPPPKCIPMDDCRRLVKNWAQTLIEEQECRSKAEEEMCRKAKAVCKQIEDACKAKPKKSAPSICKPKKTESQAAVCKPKAVKSKAWACKPKKVESKTPICKPKAPVCKPKKETPICKPKKKTPSCKAKKETPICKSKKTADKPKEPICKPQKPKERSKQEGVCKTVKSDCPPKARDSCEVEYKFKKCKGQEPPYPSFSECRPPFPKRRISECLIAKKRAKATLEILKKSIERQKRMQEGSDKKGERSYSTMCAAARARSFNLPTQWKRYYSSHAGGRGRNNFSKKLDKTKDKPKKGETNTLNQRLLAGIEEGIERLESQEVDLPNNLYYQVLKALDKLSEREVYEFFDQEAQFNPACYLSNSDVSETVSFVCKLDPKAPQSLFLNSDISFQPRCVGISDTTASSEERETVEAFRALCQKMCEEADYRDLPYEEQEKLKTEDMRRELNELLRKAQHGR